MKKILFVADSLEFGGIESTLLFWIKYLSQIKNLEITLMLLRKEGEFIEEIPKTVKIITLDKNLQNRLKPYRKAIIDNMKKINIKYFYQLLKDVIICSIKLKKMSLGEKLRYKVINETENLKDKFDVAVAYSDHSSMYYVNDKVKADKKILWIHADYGIVQRDINAIMCEYNKFDKLVFVSEELKENFLNKCEDLKEKSTVLNNILDTERIDRLKNQEVKEFSKNYINILSVGRLEEEKNYENLVKSITLLPNNLQDKCKLYIIGKGSKKNKLKKFILKNNLEENIFLLGTRKNPYCYMKKCDIYIQPSLYEGFCTTVNEAKYLEKPIIVSDVGGMRELIKNNHTGVIMNKNDAKTIFQHLQRLIENKNERKKFEKNLKNNSDDQKLKMKFLNILEIKENNYEDKKI